MGEILGARERYRQSYTVPSTSGDYASERITIGVVPGGVYGQSYVGVTALIESAPSGATVELWLRKVHDAGESDSVMDDADYFYSGQVLGVAGVANAPTGATASFGSATWPLAGWPGAQLRVKSAGVGGACVVSATAD